MKLVFKNSIPAKDLDLRYYNCDHCKQQFRKDLKPNGGDDFKYWCGECVIKLSLNPV